MSKIKLRQQDTLTKTNLTLWDTLGKTKLRQQEFLNPTWDYSYNTLALCLAVCPKSCPAIWSRTFFVGSYCLYVIKTIQYITKQDIHTYDKIKSTRRSMSTILHTCKNVIVSGGSLNVWQIYMYSWNGLGKVCNLYNRNIA